VNLLQTTNDSPRVNLNRILNQKTRTTYEPGVVVLSRAGSDESVHQVSLPRPIGSGDDSGVVPAFLPANVASAQ
jgi:hypothetical protein